MLISEVEEEHLLVGPIKLQELFPTDAGRPRQKQMMKGKKVGRGGRRPSFKRQDGVVILLYVGYDAFIETVYLCVGVYFNFMLKEDFIPFT